MYPQPVPLSHPIPPVEHAAERDIHQIASLNNLFAPDGLTLMRTEAFVTAHLQDYQVVRTRDGAVLGCVALDEYSPSLVELVSLAVSPTAQGQGIGRRLIAAAEELARQRGYPELFAISLADGLFLGMGFRESTILHYPEKILRYTKISRSELSIGRKFCFTKLLTADANGRQRA
jgi:amino-acid N-acetyltransferase